MTSLKKRKTECLTNFMSLFDLLGIVDSKKLLDSDTECNWMFKKVDEFVHIFEVRSIVRSFSCSCLSLFTTTTNTLTRSSSSLPPSLFFFFFFFFFFLLFLPQKSCSRFRPTADAALLKEGASSSPRARARTGSKTPKESSSPRGTYAPTCTSIYLFFCLYFLYC